MIEVRDNIVPAYKVWIKKVNRIHFLTELNIEDVFLLVDSTLYIYKQSTRPCK